MLQNIFKDSILVDTFVDKEFNNIIKDLLQKEKNNNKIINKSNVGGFHTQDIDNEFVINKLLFWTHKLILKDLYLNHKITINLQNLWINENLKNDYNQEHTHPGSSFSGVYYIEVPENSGNIYFKNDPKEFIELSSFFKNTEYDSHKEINNYNNQFILFPSNLRHGVYPNCSDKPRISVSFNIKITSA